jgi:hypothetical protein
MKPVIEPMDGYFFPERCTCLENEGDDTLCSIHGDDDRPQDETELEDRARERDRQSEIHNARYGF